MALDLRNMFSRHTPTPEQASDMDLLRGKFTSLASALVALTPPGPNQTLAVRHLEDALMRANKAIVEGS